MSSELARLAATIFVEGDSDLHFIMMYLKHLGFKEKLLTEKEQKKRKGLPKPQERGKIHVRIIGGNETKLFGNALLLKEAINNSDKTLVLLDANSNPEGRKKDFDKLAKEKNIATEPLFLFLLPNDKKGELENLLENISTSKEIYECFDKYEACLKNNRKITPNKKARIYAYCDSNGVPSNDKERNYDNPDYWDLESPSLDALKAFIKKHIPAPSE